jgi:outer membrane receptor protein involved in Fe transport
MKLRFTLVLWVAILTAACLAPRASAQVGASLAQLNGTVKDASGSFVPKASLTLRETDTNRSYSAASNDNGFYVFPNLQPGHYELVAEAPGFSKTTRTGIVLTVGQVATLDVDLKIVAIGERVVVSTEAVPVEPTRTEISQVIDTKQIQNLPISGRLFTDFALLTPGVATGRTSLQSTFTEFETTRISFGGMRDLSNAVTVDDADTINTATGSQRATPSQEAVSEFRVVNNSFGTEYGRALGGIVNIVTKSGTNELHGSVYDYLQNNATNARSLLIPSPQPNTLRQNQFGGTLGGPLKKDRTFFFMNYEGQRRGEAPTYPTVLVQNINAFDTAKAYVGLAPEGGKFGIAGLNSVLKTRDTDNGIVKLDHQINKDNRLSVRYNIFDGRELNLLVGDTLDGGGLGAPSSGHNAFIRDQSLVGVLTSQLAPSLVNSSLLQYARRHNTFPGVTGEPNLDVPNVLLFGHNFGTFDATHESRFQASDSVAWVKGPHVMRFGADYNFIDNFVIWPGFNPMRIILPAPNCLVQFANFVDIGGGAPLPQNLGPACPLPPFFNGVPIAFWGAPIGSGPASSLPAPPKLCSGACTPANWNTIYYDSSFPSLKKDFFVQFNHSYYGFFAQDQWRVTPKLTLNYGLRYDFESGLSRQINPDYRGVQPRVGFAYSPDKHTVIRAGFGIFDDRFNLTFAFVTFPQRPTPLPGSHVPPSRDGSDTATWALNQLPFGFPGHPAPATVAKNLLTTGSYEPNSVALPSTVGGTGLDKNSRIPYSEQASLEIDREVGKGLVVNVGYLFVAAHKLVRPENLNVCPSAGGSDGPYSCPSAYQAFLTGSNAGVLPVAPDNTIALPGLQGKKQAFSGPLYPAGLLYFLDDSGNSVYHGLTLSASQRVGNYLRLNANYTFSRTLDDGTFTTFVSTPQNLYQRASERANSNQDVRHRFVANFVADAPEHTFLRNFELSSIITAQSARPFTMFFGADGNGDTNPVTDRVGLSARNAYWGDKLTTWDVRVSRFFKFQEHKKIELAVDAFNALNRPNVNEVTSVYDAPIFLAGVPNHYKDGITSPANPDFGGPRTMFNPRQFQFSAKFTF